MPKIQCGEAEYRIMGDNGEEGDCVEYGTAATLETEDGNMLTAYVDVDEATDEPITKLPGGVWVQDLTDGTKLVEIEREEVEFDGDEDGDEEEEGDFPEEDEDDDGDDSGDEDEIEELKA
jgi:hypothetical protein